jgi:MIT (microtubule interacting and transport) domain
MLNAMTAESHPRHTSRPDSTSSSSTIRRATSLSSQPGSRTARSKVYHPNDADQLISTTSLGPSSRPEGRHRKRFSDSHHRSSSSNAAHDDSSNVHRWSQSTTSSKSSATGGSQGRKRKSSFTRRLSSNTASTFSLNKPFATSDSPPPRNVLTKSRGSPAKSSQKQHFPAKSPGSRTQVGAALPEPPRDTSLSSAIVPLAAGTTPVLHPSMLATPSSEYFAYPELTNGDQIQPISKYSNASAPIHVAAATVTLPATSPSHRLNNPDHVTHGHSRHRGHHTKNSGDTEAGSSLSSTRSETEPPRKHRSPSQKTMLSRALQKANTAVLLDNAQNFEGAMEAYADACRLLQQVMHGSTGNEDKKKLEAIV